MKSVLCVLMAIGLLSSSSSARACVQCWGGWCYPASGFGWTHCSIHCPGDPSLDCICYGGGGFCQGARGLTPFRDLALATSTSSRLEDLCEPGGKTPAMTPVSLPVPAAAPLGYPKRELPPNCVARHSADGGLTVACGPKVGSPLTSSFSFIVDPATLVQLAEVNKDLAFLLHVASRVQREMKLDLGGGVISAQVPRSAATVRSRLLGAQTSGDEPQSPVQYQYSRVGQATESTLRFVFNPYGGTGAQVVVEFTPSADATADFVLTSWRLR